MGEWAQRNKELKQATAQRSTQQGLPSTETRGSLAGHSAQLSVGQDINNSPASRKQQVLQTQIHNSPAMVAQRQQVAPLQQQSTLENKTGLPDNLKSGIEVLSGIDISDVQVHRNSAKPAQLNAAAFAQGNQIHLGAGQEQHLPHEAWHVVQQKQGRVRPTMQMAGPMALPGYSGRRLPMLMWT